MFLHFQTFGKQISLHSDKNETLLNNVEQAVEQHQQEMKADLVAFTESGKPVDLNRTAEANSLKENDVVVVTTQEEYRKKQEAETPTKTKKRAAKTN